MKKHSVVAGAGLVGSLWAIYLARMNHSVTIIEKRSDMRKATLDGGRSINLIITSRGIKALSDVGLWEEVKKITVPVYGRMMHSMTGELTYQPYGRDDRECNYSVSRAELNKTLMTLAEARGVSIKFECELVRSDFKQKTISLSNGEELSYDLLFGTDGAGSALRKEFNHLVPGFKESTEWLGADYKELLMPATQDGQYPMDERALHIWPRGSHMLMALPNQDGSFTMTAYLPSEMSDKLQTREQIAAHFEKYYGDSLEVMPDYLDQYMQNPLGRLGTVRCYPWVYQDSVALMGDASHAIVPFFGQGMNSGLEDCTVLANLMSENSDDLAQAFELYQQTRKQNADAIAAMAIENYDEMKSKVGDQNFLARKHIEHELEVLYPDLYKSRYGLVTYTLVPYNDCLEIGKIQQRMIDQIMKLGADQLESAQVKGLIEKELSPYLNERGLSLARYPQV